MKGDNNDLSPVSDNGFPSGYFLIRSVAAGRVLDVEGYSSSDGAEVILWPSTENSLVEGLRDSNADNQVFFIDDTGALCCKASGHAIDVEDRKLVQRHRRPRTNPYPNIYSHPLPKFSYSPLTGYISVSFLYDPSLSMLSREESKTAPNFLLLSVPMRRARNFGENVTDVLSMVSNSFLLLRGQHAGPSHSDFEVTKGEFDVKEDELLEEDRADEELIDDSPEQLRRVRVLEWTNTIGRDAHSRHKWEILPIRTSKARAGWSK